MSLPVYCFGEVLVDMLSSGTTNVDSNSVETFSKFAGGAPANVAVAVANLGGQAAHVGAIGDDIFGRFLERALKTHNVSIQHLKRSARKTALAFVMLDEKGERSFSFYDIDAAHNDFNQDDFATNMFDQAMVFVFGSSMLTKSKVRASTEFALEKCKHSNSISCLDINYRAGFWSDNLVPADIIMKTISSTDVVKASKEELSVLYGKKKHSELARLWLDSGTSLVVATDGEKPIEYWTKNHAGTITPPTIDVVDTTAAGDAFVGGLVHTISTNCQNRNEFLDWLENKHMLDEAIQLATQCGAVASTRKGAFPSLPFKDDLGIK